MKTSVVIVFVLGVALLHLQVDAIRLDLKKVRTGNEQAGLKLDDVNNNGANEVTPNNQPTKAGTYGNPVTGSVPAVDTKNDGENGSTSANSSSSTEDDNNNSSYGNYGNPSGSSSETHHAFTNDCQPKKGC